MKTVGIITYHASKSYGACLQAKATLEIVRKLGFYPELIDYINRKEQKRFKTPVNSLGSAAKYIRWKIKSLILRDSYWAKKAFGYTGLFYQGAVTHTKYTSLDELNKSSYDILLAGSDQVWNPAITGGIDKAFLLGFGMAEKRISYASSMGSHVIAQEEKKIFKECLERFSAVSVREVHAKNEIKKVIDIPVSIVADPTLLFNRDEWQNFLSVLPDRFKSIKDKYILSFFVGGSTDTYYSEVSRIKQKMGLPLYNIQINKYKRKNVDRALAGVNCAELISLIKNASVVVTDSYHGTVFSILFEKDFICLSNKANPVRVRELLNSLGLDERLDNLECLNDKIDYDSVSKKLIKIREESIEWLKNALTA
ncbi:polysaccharide pyruvyl transferase [Herbinix hemicellulosilytica]|uniref:Polysaccharide pyruvyl transferase domain-containing protein n=1 Tax=Herbinix hemicellulosilytica TaxID=1564487 RepID=A0A0H5SGL0_HERHM|nr:polysaccharide pyruvyl transferase family protein [Herbinix hemicellulosilytica]RBP60942.1 polysaccharide pyruvyl transferase [Herbinix hemicellulosilytica]CRZ34637.1 hypothetical protein HHT355_1436 [Herbinix hemicellulosilytica]